MPDEKALGSDWIRGRVCSKADPDVVKTNIRPLSGTKQQLSIPAPGHLPAILLNFVLYTIKNITSMLLQV
jgi:hypothetical protein